MVGGGQTLSSIIAYADSHCRVGSWGNILADWISDWISNCFRLDWPIAESVMPGIDQDQRTGRISRVCNHSIRTQDPRLRRHTRDYDDAIVI